MHWPAFNLRADLCSPWLEIVLVLAAILSGAIIGTERERHDKPAGVRTLILISLGAALFTMVSYAFVTTTGDSGRVAAQIVTGVGFLGAGAIIHSHTTVSGMTTAAAIWLTAAIGIAIGIGRPVGGLGLAVLTRVILVGVRRWEIRHLGGLKSALVEIIFDPDHGKTQIRLDRLRECYRLRTPFTIEPRPNSPDLQGRLLVELPRRQLHEFLAEIVDLSAIREIRSLPPPSKQPGSVSLLLCLLGVLVSGPALAGEPAVRPNILWITAEDLSPNLGCYGDAYARTPHLDAFAAQGIRYTRAFATAPVCSPARSCLITGMYATSLGTQRLRSEFPVPAHVRGFAALLREKGYWTANNVKTDYNLRDEKAFIRDCWDECSPRAHWRGRKPGQPFFAVFNLMVTHQSRASVWPHAQFEEEVASKLSPEERHDPAEAPLPPYYPATMEARRTWARYHDCITVMDKQVAALLRELAEDSLDKNTIVFFYGDNGMGLPRGKRCLWDTGLWEPLLVRFPDAFGRFAPGLPGSVSDRLVSFVDFAPTVLSLCRIPIPPHMQGIPFLGQAAGRARSFVFGARDRVDEAFELSRSVRDQRYLYVRNYMPHLSWMPPEHFSDASTFRLELQRLRSEGRLNPRQLTYAATRKAVEELYDTETDPHQVRNLADDPDHRAILKKMRSVLRDWQLETRDAGFLSEPQVRERMRSVATPLEMARDDRHYPLRRLLGAADLVGRDAVMEQVKLLLDPDDGVRYWAAVGLHAAGNNSDDTLAALRRALSDTSAVVRIEAAQALVERGDSAEPLLVLETALRSTEKDVALHAARALELLGEKARPVWPAMRQVLEQVRREATPGDLTMFLRFSLGSALRERD